VNPALPDGPAVQSGGSAVSDAPPAAPPPDWLRHTLTITGPAGSVAKFRAAASGPGTIPWHLDLDHEEARLLAPMITEGVEARLLARALRAAIAVNHAKVLAGEGRGCAFDLHRLVPVPASILALGDDAPAARHWLWSHWGTVWPLRHVRSLERHEDRRLRRTARFVVAFRSADWTPWQAISRLRRDWSDLVFAIQPHYDDG
jgi:hypothetical protein